jgi:hypothetical protein
MQPKFGHLISLQVVSDGLLFIIPLKEQINDLKLENSRIVDSLQTELESSKLEIRRLTQQFENVTEQFSTNLQTKAQIQFNSTRSISEDSSKLSVFQEGGKTAKVINSGFIDVGSWWSGCGKDVDLVFRMVRECWATVDHQKANLIWNSAILS